MEGHIGERTAGAHRLTAAGVLAFVLEAALLCAAGLWALEVLPLPPLAAMAAVALPLAVFWGLCMSPRARLRIRWPAHPFIAHGFFAAGAALLHLVDRPVLGWSMLGLTLLSSYLAWRHRGARAGGRRAAR